MTTILSASPLLTSTLRNFLKPPPPFYPMYPTHPILEESLLTICSLGIQTQTLSPSYLLPASTRFIPTAQIRDIFIHEAFRGFEVRYYLAIVVEGEWDVVVVFPVSFCSFFEGEGKSCFLCFLVFDKYFSGGGRRNFSFEREKRERKDRKEEYVFKTGKGGFFFMFITCLHTVSKYEKVEARPKAKVSTPLPPRSVQPLHLPFRLTNPFVISSF